MQDDNKTKAELINELIVLRQRVDELEKVEAEYKEVKNELVQSRQCFKNILNSKDDSLIVKDRRDLINAVAERIGKIIKNKQTEEALRESEEKWRSLSENMCPFGKHAVTKKYWLDNQNEPQNWTFWHISNHSIPST